MTTPTAYPTDPDVVLIVDDVPANLALLCDALDDAGYEVLVATDGASALERVRQVTPDAILLDARMPGLDGFDTCRLIKAETNCAGVPVIFMTALTQTENIVKGLAAGGVDYVTKPITPDEVIARLAVHIRNSRELRDVRSAIDGAGQAVLVFDGFATEVWSSSRAGEILGSDDAAADSLHAQLAGWMRARIVACVQQSMENPDLGLVCGGRQVVARFLGGIGKGRYLCALDVPAEGAAGASVSVRFGLTPRELEVLGWIMNGKTDRDVADILGMSPRTVNKHLEHIYVKLGVETRTAAAAMVQGGRAK
jgi:DNA-binding response OmpR family regulator/DNA-binding CsgD family transcriptional regulator